MGVGTGIVGGTVASAIASQVVDELREQIAEAVQDQVTVRDVRDAFVVALHDAGELRRANTYLVETVASGDETVVRPPREFDQNPGLWLYVHDAPSSGLHLEINGGPEIPDVPLDRSIDSFDIQHLKIDNTGSAQAVIIIGGRTGRAAADEILRRGQ